MGYIGSYISCFILVLSLHQMIIIISDGKFIPDDRVIPFGVGKRYCLGQSLAEKEFYIFLTALLQKFEFQRVPGTTLPSYVDIRHPVSFLRVPHPFEVILQKRF